MPAEPRTPSVARAPLRLLTWNVRHLLGDPLAVHRILRSAAPDLVCLQEAPRLPWSQFQLAALARATGLRTVAGGWSGAGTAMLRSTRLLVHDPVAVRFSRNGRLPRRGAVLASVALPGAPLIRVASIHLGLDLAERQAHVQQLITWLRAARLPTVIAGDLNEPPTGPAWQAFSIIATDSTPQSGPTFPAARPQHRIDAVLTAPGLQAHSVDWRPTRRDAYLASDHLPLLTVIAPA